MALHLNLLHEEILEHRQRRRDPLKIGIMVLVAIGLLMVFYYMWNAYRTLEIKGRLATVERDWAKVEPQVTAAQKRAAELSDIIKTTRTLDEYIDGRFFWAPFLQKVTRCVAPNTQLTGIEVALSSVGFIFLLYVYFTFFLGPLNRSRNTMLITMKDKQAKLDSSKGEMSKAATLEKQAKAATTRFAALKALNPEGAPIAWFPP